MRTTRTQLPFRPSPASRPHRFAHPPRWPMRGHLTAVALALGVLLVLVTACGSSTTTGSGPSPTVSPRGATVLVYFTRIPTRIMTRRKSSRSPAQCLLLPRLPRRCTQWQRTPWSRCWPGQPGRARPGLLFTVRRPAGLAVRLPRRVPRLRSDPRSPWTDDGAGHRHLAVLPASRYSG